MNSRDIRRKYGQNYLKDPAILFEMSEAISPNAFDNFIEIGPGHGALTNQMNRENIDTYQVMDENWKNYLFKILVDFNKQTKSKRAAFIIENFDKEITKFIHVVPDEVIDKLSFPVKENHKIA